ncbi:MAG: alanyl-tRNA editing protein [Thermoplasmata archaeon]|nr:alanyl-tRNA editing protein [Thermoplasmata archaeon]
MVDLSPAGINPIYSLHLLPTMTEMLYMTEGCYLKEFDAKVVAIHEKSVVFDRTACYPDGGGQPSDTGVLQSKAGTAKITHVKKAEGEVYHEIDGPLPEVGETVHVSIDWERRYAHMRMHTAQHLLSGIVYKFFQARTVGNQIYADRSRVDFMPVNFTDADVQRVVAEFDGAIKAQLPVRIYMMEKDKFLNHEEGERANIHLLPPEIKVLRIVEIPGYDMCPCAGTHVASLAELGKIKILKVERKGKDRYRIAYTLG